MPRILKAIPFTKADIHLVQDFYCGSEPYETPLADWIKNESLEALRNRLKIWRFHDPETDRLVGYGSVGKAKWTLINEDDSERVTNCLCIPTVAIQMDFQGKPDGAVGEEKYSWQIIRYLQKQARDKLERTESAIPILQLFVHPKQTKGQKLYKNCGFRVFPGKVRRDEATGADCLCMVYNLT